MKTATCWHRRRTLPKRATVESEFEEALSVLHNLEPLGVGATSLKECLCLQLDEDDALRLLLDEIDLTGSADVHKLADSLDNRNSRSSRPCCASAAQPQARLPVQQPRPLARHPAGRHHD